MLRKVSNKARRLVVTSLILRVAVSLVTVLGISVFGGRRCILSSRVYVIISELINLWGGQYPIEFVSHRRLEEQSILERIATHNSDVVSKP